MANFTSLIQVVGIALELCRFLDSADIIRLIRVSRDCRDAFHDNKYQLFNIHGHLSKYFDNTTDFRMMQARTGATISGSFALQFFLRTDYPDANLDLYVHVKAKDEVGTWLMANGYHFTRKTLGFASAKFEETVNERLMMMAHYQQALEYVDRNAARGNAVHIRGCLGVMNFIARRSGQVRVVQVMVVESAPIQLILGFHSTCVLNFITYDYAFCLYPKATVERSFSLALKRPSVYVENEWAKYLSRGFLCLRVAEPEQRSLFRLDDVRCAEDGYAWRFELPRLLSMPFGTRYSSPITATTWSVVTRAQDGHEVYFTMWDDEPAIFPLAVATAFIRDTIHDTMYTIDSTFDFEEGTCNGADSGTQDLVRELRLMFRHGAHTQPSTFD